MNRDRAVKMAQHYIDKGRADIRFYRARNGQWMHGGLRHCLEKGYTPTYSPNALLIHLGAVK